MIENLVYTIHIYFVVYFLNIRFKYLKHGEQIGQYKALY